MDVVLSDKLWIVEWIPHRESYRISKFADPDKAIAYEDNWEEAVHQIRQNYTIDNLIIFIRKEDGSVNYYCDSDYV